MSAGDDDAFVTIHHMTDSDVAVVMEIVKSLPQWFTAGSMETIGRDVAFQKGIVAMLQGKIVGFVTFYVAQGKGYIGWMGIAAEHHRRGIGRMLVECLAGLLTQSGIHQMLITVPGESIQHEPHARTRAFCRTMGFVDHQRIFSSEPDCPEMLSMILSLKH